MVPLASAAALALFWGAANRGPATNSKVAESGVVGDDLLAELVAEHSQPLPVETTDPRSLEKWVGVPVHPARFERDGAQLVGGRVLPVQQQRAAMLQYVVRNGDETRRVSVLVYDPEKIRVNDAALTTRPVGTAQIHVGTAHGYTVAVANNGGIGYAVASDLSPEQSAQLAALVYEENK
jgi:anti-sigma factor RsiW